MIATKKYISPVGNLLKAMLGSGFLPMPTLFFVYGIIPAAFLLLFSCGCAIIGLNLFLTLNAHYKKHSTLSTLAYEICPLLKYVADIAVCFKCVGVSLAYIVLIKKQIIIVIEYFDCPFDVKIPLLIFVLFVSVVSALGKFDKLKYTSVFGLVALLFMVLLSFFIIKDPLPIPLFHMDKSIIGKFGNFVYAYTCHQAILGMQNELGYSLSFFRRTIIIVCGLAFLLFVTFGFPNSLAHDYSATGKVKSWEEMLPETYIGAIIRFILSIVVLLSVPIQMTAYISYSMGLVSNIYDRLHIRLLLSSTTLMLLYLIALNDINILSVIEVIGCTVSAFMCQMLPAIYFILADKKVHTPLMLVSAYFLLCIGIFVAVTGIYAHIGK